MTDLYFRRPRIGDYYEMLSERKYCRVKCFVQDPIEGMKIYLAVEGEGKWREMLYQVFVSLQNISFAYVDRYFAEHKRGVRL